MARLITDILGDAESGAFVVEVTNGFDDLVQAVQTLGKKGTMTLKIEVAPNGVGACNIKTSYNITEPKEDRAQTMFFVGKDGALTRQDPRQQEMKLVKLPEEDRTELEEIS